MGLHPSVDPLGLGASVVRADTVGTSVSNDIMATHQPVRGGNILPSPGRRYFKELRAAAAQLHFSTYAISPALQHDPCKPTWCSGKLQRCERRPSDRLRVTAASGRSSSGRPPKSRETLFASSKHHSWYGPLAVSRFFGSAFASCIRQ